MWVWDFDIISKNKTTNYKMKNKPITILRGFKMVAVCLIAALTFSSCGLFTGSRPSHDIKPGTWVSNPDGSQTFR